MFGGSGMGVDAFSGLVQDNADRVGLLNDFLNNLKFNANFQFGNKGGGGGSVSLGNQGSGFRPPNRAQNSQQSTMDMLKILDMLKGLGVYI